VDIAARVKHPEERVGDTLLKKWHLDELLGIGAMAAVFSATHRNGKRVAIKLLHMHLADEPVIVKRFLREGYAANKVGHPAVVSALDDNVTKDGCPFLVLDLLEGRPLDDVLRERGPMEPTEVLTIADQVLDALTAAHDKGVIHRDLKPENLLLASDGTVRMLDFGIARVDEGHTQDPRLTVPGRAMGTPGFMAPEQAQGLWDKVDARTDLWSIGACMFSLLTGREVHEATKAHELLIAAMTRPVQPLAEVAPHVPDNVCAIVDRALAFDQSDRFPSALVMQEWVRDANQQLQAPLASLPEGPTSGPPSLTPSSLTPSSLTPPTDFLSSQENERVTPPRRGGFGRIVSTFVLSAAACVALHVYYAKSKGLPVVPNVLKNMVVVKPLSAGLPAEAAKWVDKQTIDLDAVVLQEDQATKDPAPDEDAKENDETQTDASETNASDTSASETDDDETSADDEADI